MNTAKVDSGTLDRSAPDEPEHLALVDGPPPDHAAWVAAVDQVLRRARRIADTAPAGAGVEALTWSTPDGIAVRPLYTADDAAELPDAGVPGAPTVRPGRPARRGGPRRLGRAAAARPTPIAREAILADLENGATSIWLAVGAAGTAVADLPKALDGVLLDLAPVVLDASASPAEAEAAAQAYLELGAGARRPGRAARHARPRPHGRPGPHRVGPGRRVRRPARPARVAGTSRWCAPSSSTGCRCTPRAGRTPRSSATSLAAGVAYLRALTAAGLGVDAAARPAGVPLRRHRRPVPDHREAARRPPAVGAGAGGVRRAPGRRRRSASTRSPRRR